VLPEFIFPTTVPPLDHAETLRLRGRVRFLISSSAWKMSLHRGVDLYGLDLLIDATAALVHERKLDVGLVLLVANPEDAGYRERLRERATARGIEDRCSVVGDPLEEAASLWKISDIVVRNTN